jgi:signal peptidase I
VAVLKRFVVDEDSMRPTLEPGDGLVAVPLRRARVGAICVVRSPACPSMWLVKRVVAGPGATVEAGGTTWVVGDGEMFVLSDDRSITRADSRRFGPLPCRGAYRVVLRVPRRLMG